MPTPSDYLAISNAMYTKIDVAPLAPIGWSLVSGSTTALTTSGMMAATFKNPLTGEIVVGFQGTNQSSGSDAWLQAQKAADLQIWNGETPQAYLDAAAYVQKVQAANPGASIFVTGHSLGAAEAEYVAVKQNVGGAGFAGPGIPDYTDDGSHNNFTSYLNHGDLIGAFSPDGGGHVGTVVPLGSPLEVLEEAAAGPLWAGLIALSNHALSTYALNLLGPDTPTPVPPNIQKMLDDPFDTLGNGATSQFTILPDGTLLTTYKAADGTLLGNTTQNADGSGSISLFSTSGQSWISETGFFNTKGQLASAQALQTNGDLAQTSFDTGNNQPWSSLTTVTLDGKIISQQEIFDSLNQQLKEFDTGNHPWTELDVSEDATGNPTGVQVALDPAVAAAGSVGQVLGSAIGHALAPNNPFVQLAAGTVVGAIGQQLSQAIA
jgi:hypothetical protein